MFISRFTQILSAVRHLPVYLPRGINCPASRKDKSSYISYSSPTGLKMTTTGPNTSTDAKDYFNDKVTADGRFKPESGRYHLYASKFCPFAHRVLLARRLKNLDAHISVSWVHWLRLPVGGWKFQPDEGYVDDLFGSDRLAEVYEKARPGFTGKHSVPILWDKKENTIVSNMSDEISRMLLTEFDGLDGVTKNEDLRPKVDDELIKWIHDSLNTGVYKVGFAPNQAVYETEIRNVFRALNKLESMIAQSGGKYILGDKLTEADLRAYPTIVRFDTAYVNVFKCNLGTIRGNYPAIHAWLKNLYWNHAEFRETTWFNEFKNSYFKSMSMQNPTGLTSLGPVPDIEPLDGVKGSGVEVPEVEEGKVVFGGRIRWDE